VKAVNVLKSLSNANDLREARILVPVVSLRWSAAKVVDVVVEHLCSVSVAGGSFYVVFALPGIVKSYPQWMRPVQWVND
jgi:hypothetical protein